MTLAPAGMPGLLATKAPAAGDCDQPCRSIQHRSTQPIPECGSAERAGTCVCSASCASACRQDGAKPRRAGANAWGSRGPGDNEISVCLRSLIPVVPSLVASLSARRPRWARDNDNRRTGSRGSRQHLPGDESTACISVQGHRKLFTEIQIDPALPGPCLGPGPSNGCSTHRSWHVPAEGLLPE